MGASVLPSGDLWKCAFTWRGHLCVDDEANCVMQKSASRSAASEFWSNWMTLEKGEFRSVFFIKIRVIR